MLAVEEDEDKDEDEEGFISADGMIFLMEEKSFWTMMSWKNESGEQWRTLMCA